MKDNIILCLWIVYTIGFGVFGVYIDQKADAVEVLGLSCIFAQILLGIYLLLVLGFNSLLSRFIKFRIKLSPPKRFKNKVTPIYKLVPWEETKNCFSISKYQLEWTNFGATSYRFWLLPFITLFQHYKYVPVDCYEFEMDLDGVTNIGLLWEGKYAKKYSKELELKSAAQKELEKVNKLNKVFLENYE
ncbi:MAG TPA: hypothetical protein VLA48_02495 [Nitrososphaeraceae archaeon]|nr:hypothetical protein [Nitrososphaeraceae archaeon]